MPADDDRTRRRLGDETKSRIADLASGWSVDPGAPSPAAPDGSGPDPGPPPAQSAAEPGQADVDPPRKKQRTIPPPAPGSPERRALEAKIVATPPERDDATEELPPARPTSSTGSQAAIAARPRSTTGSQDAVAARPRSTTGSQDAITTAADPRSTQPYGAPPPVPPPRPKAPSGQVPAVGARPKAPSGQVPAIVARPKAPSSAQAVVARPKAPSSAQAVVVSPGDARTTEPHSGVPGRAKPPTLPPPPPGSPERARDKPASVPPTARAKSPSAPPSGPKFPRATLDGPTPLFGTEQHTFASEPRTPPVIVDASIAEPSARAVPTGEFDSGTRMIEDHITARRDPAEAILSIPDAETPVEDLLEDDDARRHRSDATPPTEKFERGDPTQVGPPDATQIAPMRGPKHPTGGTLRASAALRRKRGLYGDVRYVFTAVFGVRRSRREVVELDHRQGLRQTSRRRHLITLGRTAAVMDAFDHPAIGKARELLAMIEDERSKHAGAVAASDAELERVRRERENKSKQHALAISEADAELAELAATLDPVEKEALGVRKRASELREELRRIEKQIADAEASLSSGKAEKLDRATIQADVATYRANKEAVLRDEPVIAAQLDGLNPRIAAMEATRAELIKKKVELDRSEQEDQRRTVELLEAIGAKRKVVERAAADAETARDNALFELGDRLYLDRPPMLTPQMSPIEQIDLELGESDRRSMEIREILSNIDKVKFARGLAMIILALAAVGCVMAWLFYALM